MTTEFDQLCDFLKEMFQFEDHDLDFGIYRIIRLKREWVDPRMKRLRQTAKSQTSVING